MARYRQAFDMMPSLRLAADAPGRTPVQNARMFAVYQMAFDDAALAMVEAKLHYNFWRPITAIRNGADDGNDATPARCRLGAAARDAQLSRISLRPLHRRRGASPR